MSSGRRTRALLACGLIAPLVYLATDSIASSRDAGYSWTDQAVSELFALEAPTHDLVVTLFTIYNALLFAFAVGVWRAARDSRARRAIAVLLAASACLGVATDFFAPMHLRGTPQGSSGQWHLILTGVQTLFIFAALACGTRTLGQSFRAGSWFAIVILLVAGPLTGWLTGDMESATATPWLGVAERVLIYAWLAWTGALAIASLHADTAA